jgi:hypothetical protein
MRRRAVSVACALVHSEAQAANSNLASRRQTKRTSPEDGGGTSHSKGDKQTARTDAPVQF